MSKILYSLKSIHKVIRDNKPSQVCLVTSKKLSETLNWAIKEIGVSKSKIIFIPDGEHAKDWSEIQKLLQKFIDLHLDRQSVVIVLGGGTAGDSVGFAASIYLRGIKYIQVPTTLLAQVDSAHGGKTGINFANCKNQIGSFCLPVATIIDSRFIKTLGYDLVVDGLGEIIKAGFIKDASILSLLKKHTVRTLVQSSDLERIVKKSIAVKDYFVSRDYKDSNLRSILNVGHTFGHAIELKYKISHGMAVIVGMLQEFKLTEELGFSRAGITGELESLLGKLGIMINTNMKASWKTILHDKKIFGDQIALPVVASTGNAKIVRLKLKVLMLK
jgi:3-dehydroquinate synthase